MATKKKTAKKSTKTRSPAKRARGYSHGQRLVLVVAYSVFASVFILFANEANSSTWYYLLAVVCLAMVFRHVAGILYSYGSKK
jgi:uncharacterized membrane protein SirB2